MLACLPHAWLWWPPKKTNDQLGYVLPKEGPPPFRVEVWLDGRTVKGPKSQRRREADADLEAMQALPRTDMATFLQRPREGPTTTAHGGSSASTVPSASAMPSTERNAQKRKSTMKLFHQSLLLCMGFCNFCCQYPLLILNLLSNPLRSS